MPGVMERRGGAASVNKRWAREYKTRFPVLFNEVNSFYTVRGDATKLSQKTHPCFDSHVVYISLPWPQNANKCRGQAQPPAASSTALVTGVLQRSRKSLAKTQLSLAEVRGSGKTLFHP